MFSVYRYLTTLNKMAHVSQPLVVVLGATGTGKSKLAIEIAQKFNGEILSADSMQVYKGLDIITNKVTAEEQSLVKHHLLDFVNPLDDFYVHQFRDKALKVIKQLHSAGKLPVVVGGTHYYIESVLWQVLVQLEHSSSQHDEGDASLYFPPVSQNSSLHLRTRESLSGKPSTVVSTHDGSLACKPSAIELKGDGILACKPSAVELQSESILACKPSAIELQSDSSLACKPSVIELKRESSLACKPSAVESKSDNSLVFKPNASSLSSEDSVACKPSVLDIRSENILACKPCAVESSENSVACKPSVVTLGSTVGGNESDGENVFGRDTEIAHQQRDAVPLSLGSDKEHHSPVCHRYDASSGEKSESNTDSQSSSDRMFSIFHTQKTGIEVERSCLVEPNLGTQQVCERTRAFCVDDSTHALYAHLMSVDRKRAEMLHPNDRRKIIRSLEVWQQTGLPHSEHLSRQRAAEGGSVFGGGLRYPNTVVLWVSSDQEVLDARLDARVDDMLEKGLVAELLDFHDRYNKRRLKMVRSDSKFEHCKAEFQSPLLETTPKSDASVDKRSKRCRELDEQSPQHKKIKARDVSTIDIISTDVTDSDISAALPDITDAEQNSRTTEDAASASEVPEKASSVEMKPIADYTLGIFQSIGFKEFHDYLVLSPEERESDKGQILYKSGVERLKLVTRRYARRQVKWIRNRFTGALGRQVPPMYRLDTTDPRNWQSSVHAPAVAIVGALLEGEAPPATISPVSAPPTSPHDIEGRFSRHECNVCDRVFIGDHQWQAHLASNIHKKCKEKKRKLSSLQPGQTAISS